MQEYLAKFGIFTDDDIAELLTLGRKKHLKPNDYFIQDGSVCKEIGFIISGIFRSFYFSDHSDEITYCFSFPDTLIAGYSSYISGEPTPENIQAITKAEILVFSKDDLNSLIDSNPKWLLFSKIIAEQQYLEMEKRVFTLQKDKAEIRYQNLLSNHPEYLQKIPLQYIASYLGITQRHLSRLRKALAN